MQWIINRVASCSEWQDYKNLIWKVKTMIEQRLVPLWNNRIKDTYLFSVFITLSSTFLTVAGNAETTFTIHQMWATCTLTALEEQCTEPRYLALSSSGSLGADVLASGQQEEGGYMGRQLLLAMNGCKHIPSTVFLLNAINARRAAANITAIRISTNADRPPATPPAMAPAYMCSKEW